MAERLPKAQGRVISAEEFAKGWDWERRVTDLNDLTFHLRGTSMYVPARTKADMDAAMGGPTPAVRTRTFAREYKVWISPCLSDTPDCRILRPANDSQGTAEFAFGIPLRKMGIKVPFTRQYTFEAERIPVEGGGVVYQISFKEFENIPRNIDEAALQAAKQAKAEKAKARRARKQPRNTGASTTGAGATGAATAGAGTTEPGSQG